MVTAKCVREFFGYNPITGILFRTKTINSRAQTGTIINTRDKKGYIIVGFANKRYKAHRIIWLLVTGCWPKDHIDHINGDKSDNRWLNLREATNSQNHYNMGPTKLNRSGLKGVGKHADGKWRAYIKGNGKLIHLGLFDSPEVAHEAYRVAARKFHGKFARFA